jgi:hypothetical protein
LYWLFVNHCIKHFRYFTFLIASKWSHLLTAYLALCSIISSIILILIFCITKDWQKNYMDTLWHQWFVVAVDSFINLVPCHWIDWYGCFGDDTLLHVFLAINKYFCSNTISHLYWLFLSFDIILFPFSPFSFTEIQCFNKYFMLLPRDGRCGRMDLPNQIANIPNFYYLWIQYCWTSYF